MTYSRWGEFAACRLLRPFCPRDLVCSVGRFARLNEPDCVALPEYSTENTNLWIHTIRKAYKDFLQRMIIHGHRTSKTPHPVRSAQLTGVPLS